MKTLCNIIIHVITPLLIGALIGVGIGWAFLPHPLTQLTRKIRAIPYTESGYRNAPGHEQFWRAVQLSWTIEHYVGYSVTFGTPGPGLGGTTDQNTRAIMVDAQQTWNERLIALAHEGGHALQPKSMSKGEAEVFAEAVSYLVCRRFGFDSTYQSAHYLAMYKPQLHIIDDYQDEIEWAVMVLVGEK